jgi:trans-2,3-dihydro-3-hydroxyanthranilate isomerase
MPYSFIIADVFTDTAFGGNQLAVFLDARGLSDNAMQAMTREMNFSESTFLLPPNDPSHTRRLRIFTPGMEVPFAGHPTVGTAAVLASRGFVGLHDGKATVILEEGVGPVRVDVEVPAMR